MKKLLLLLLLPFSLFGQTTYQLNYDSIRVNKTTGTGGTSLYGKVYLKNVGLGLQSDSILTVKNGRIRKVAVTETGGGGGGSSISYYLNGSVNQGTFVGNVYREMNKTPIFGAGTDFTIATNGYITQFITDANDPNSLLIPAGNWNFETYFSASSGGGSPSFYVELYKYNGTTFTLIASSSATPELISFGTAIQPYFSTLAVPETVLLATDRLAVRFYVNNSGRTITMHTENGHLSQIITTFTTGLQALNGLTKQTQYFATGTSGTDFGISSTTDTHTFNLPDASTTARGVVTTGTQTFAGLKTFENSGITANFNRTVLGGAIVGFQILGVDKSFLEWNVNDAGSVVGTAMNLRNNQGAIGLYDNSNTGLKIASGSGVFAGSSSATAFIPTAATIPVNGMYLSGTNTLNFATNSVNRLSIGSAGNTAIGIASATERLHLANSTNGFVGLRLEGTSSYAGSDWIMYASSNSAPSADDFLGFFNNSATDGATTGYKFTLNKSGSATFANLAGTGTRIVEASSTGVLSATVAAPTSGTYTPTLTNVTNVASSSVSTNLRYIRVGNVVSFSLIIVVNPTALGNCQVDFSIPIASNFKSVNRMPAVVKDKLASTTDMYIESNVANDRGSVFFNSTAGAVTNIQISGHYEIE